MSFVLVKVTHRTGKLENSLCPSVAGQALCSSQRCVLRNFSPCICAITQFLQEGQKADKQVVAIESPEEKKDQDHLNVPKYNIKKSF